MARTKKPATPPKKRMGRPPKKPGESRTAWLRLRVTPAEKSQIAKLAEAAGLSVTEYVVRRATSVPRESR